MSAVGILLTRSRLRRYSRCGDTPLCAFYGYRGIAERDQFREQSFTRKLASARYYTQFSVTAEDATCRPSQSSTLNVSREYKSTYTLKMLYRKESLEEA